MTDLVTRLRTHGCEFRETEDLLREAVDEIESLKRENERLKKLIASFGFTPKLIL